MAAVQAITLQGMRFHALVGILAHEAEHPQPLEIDLTVWCAPPLRKVVDYRELYAIAASVAARRLPYLEDAAAAIADATLTDQHIERVRIAVRKPHVALPGPLAYAEVVLERSRSA